MFTLPELQLIRAGLDHITIKGADSKFLTQLQLKIEQLLNEPDKIVESQKPKK